MNERRDQARDLLAMFIVIFLTGYLCGVGKAAQRAEAKYSEEH